MPVTLFSGLRQVPDFTSGERPQDYSETLLVLDPNGDTPFTAMSAYMDSKPTTDIIFHWFEKPFPEYRVQAAADYGTATDTMQFHRIDTSNSAVNMLRPGFVLLHEASGEELLITAVDYGTGDVSVVRNFNGVGAANPADDAGFTVLTNAYGTGTNFPNGLSRGVDELSNNTEIFKGAAEITRTAAQTEIRWSPNGAFDELKREGFQTYALQHEMAALFGSRVSPTTDPSGGGLIYKTQGLVASIPTANKYSPGSNGMPADGLVTRAFFHDIVKNMFKYGSKSRVCLCGGDFFSFFLDYVEEQQLRIAERGELAEKFSIKVVKWEGHWGAIEFWIHPLMWNHPVWTKNAVFFDLMSVGGRKGKCARVMQPLEHQENVQLPGDDKFKAGWIEEKGFEWPHAVTDMYISGVEGYGG